VYPDDAPWKECGIKIDIDVLSGWIADARVIPG